MRTVQWPLRATHNMVTLTAATGTSDPRRAPQQHDQTSDSAAVTRVRRLVGSGPVFEWFVDGLAGEEGGKQLG